MLEGMHCLSYKILFQGGRWVHSTLLDCPTALTVSMCARWPPNPSTTQGQPNLLFQTVNGAAFRSLCTLTRLRLSAS